ncbi:hypothetical protein CEXT_705481 [Caerostris extrusa]|uniref:HNH endonuclease n=1 Tax=Caerostris extrusa TaxID=172846 RepID=A0AAV4Q588_CAEEX|nr:hypothetical protein CEXT_705481 [Caerostris extrusa]
MASRIEKEYRNLQEYLELKKEHAYLNGNGNRNIVISKNNSRNWNRNTGISKNDIGNEIKNIGIFKKGIKKEKGTPVYSKIASGMRIGNIGNSKKDIGNGI